MGRVILCVLLAAACVSCRKEAASPPAAQSATATQQVFEAKGVVKSINPRAKQIEIKHEAVPGYMPAMTMPFDVKDTNELAGLAPGEAVSFRLIDAGTDAWIDHLRRIDTSNTNAPLASPQTRLARDVALLQPGDLLPEYHLTNQLGRPFTTAQFRGQALAITFLFTRCPYPTFCPRMASNFEEVQKKLLARSNAPTNWHLLTVSFDPQFDTPAVLAAYAQAHEYNPAHWTYATGDLVDITALGEQFGLQFWHDASGSISHNLRTAVINAAGRVQTILQGNEWSTDALVTAILEAARKP